MFGVCARSCLMQSTKRAPTKTHTVRVALERSELEVQVSRCSAHTPTKISSSKTTAACCITKASLLCPARVFGRFLAGSLREFVYKVKMVS